MATQILLPPSRIVEGNVYKPSNIGLNGQIKAKAEFYFAMAIAKSEPRLGEVFGAFLAEAKAGYAANQHILNRMVQRDQTGREFMNLAGGFAWKIADGDAPDRRERPGQAGCWIFKSKTTWDIKVVDAQNVLINPALLRTGFWCDALVNIAPNGKLDHTAGVYVNPQFVRWLFPGYGEEIIPGPQADKVMGAAPSQLPPGAQPQRVGQPGSPAGTGPGVGGSYPQQAAPGAPNVGYSAPAGKASHQTPGGWQAPQVNPQQNPAHAAPQATTYPPTNSGTPSQYAGPAATTGPSEYPTHQPPAHASGPAAQGPGPAAAVPGGAHYTPQAQASPTAYPSSAPPVAGFAHGNPQA